MKIRFLIIINLLLATSSISARQNWIDGFVVTLNKDTLYGQILYETQHINFSICAFRSPSLSTAFTPVNIISYQIPSENKYYVSSSIILEKEAPVIKFFAECLVDGFLSLYFYEDSINNYKYYILKQSESDYFVIRRKPDEITDGLRKADYRYRGMLTNYFKEYDEIVLKSSYAKFDHKDMIEIVTMYNNITCSENCTQTVYHNDPKDFMSYKFGISTGVNSEKIIFRPYNLSSNTIKSTYFVIALKASASYIKASKNLSLFTEILFTKSFIHNVETGVRGGSCPSLGATIGLNYTTDFKYINPVIEVGWYFLKGFYDYGYPSYSTNRYYSFFNGPFVSAGLEIPINYKYSVSILARKIFAANAMYDLMRPLFLTFGFNF